jgi:hypothetical protein
MKRDDMVVIIDPFCPKRQLLRRVVALTDDYVKISNGGFMYNAKVEDGCYFVVNDQEEGMVICFNNINIILNICRR